MGIPPIQRGIVSQVTGSQRVTTSAKASIRHIQKIWDSLPPAELAEKIIDLEGRVALLPDGTPGLQKIKAQFEHLEFQFVFPIVLELKQESHSFAKTVHDMAQRILKTQSLAPLSELNETQKREITRYARRQP